MSRLDAYRLKWYYNTGATGFIILLASRDAKLSYFAVFLAAW